MTNKRVGSEPQPAIDTELEAHTDELIRQFVIGVTAHLGVAECPMGHHGEGYSDPDDGMCEWCGALSPNLEVPDEP